MEATARAPRFQPTSLADIDRIIDLYYYEAAPEGEGKPRVGGAGAYCYFGTPECGVLGGTELEPWVNSLMSHVSTGQQVGEDFRVEFEGRAWRACRDVSEQGTQISLRRLPTSAPVLTDLKMEEIRFRDILQCEWLNEGGLVLVCGLTGQGKSTIAGGTVVTRLKRYGGRCLTVEDTIEVPMEGLWNLGSCRQLKVDYYAEDEKLRGFSGAIRRAYRSMPATRPSMLFIGEVRDSETAVEVLKAASNGMLVITTIHSFDPASALLRLESLARSAMGEAATMALSQALRVVLHMRLQLAPDKTGWGRGHFTGTMLVSDGSSHPLGNVIRRADYAQVAQIQQTQQIRLKQAGACVPVEDLLKSLNVNLD
ncbi:MAG: hypothetical protein A2580_08630 [Hydrogenophilales bacterium RIFOXYD1_FULL_62_11]|nr:MAG: hypothetical protein A2580_08630 [Hydrogenophilales bacterium RIFOXYD1_FULL_62_11]